MSEEKVNDKNNRERRGYRSAFWPLILIGAGALWLLANLDVISGANLSVLVRLWPLILIAVGIDVLFAHRSPLVGGLLGLATIGLGVGLVLAGPSLGLADEGSPSFFGVPFVIDGDVDIKSDTFTAPLGDAQSASITLDLSRGHTIASALSGSDDLIDANLHYLGTIRFDVDEGRMTTVTLNEVNAPSNIGGFGFNLPDQLLWDIGLSADVPLELVVDGGSGPVDLYLSGLELVEFGLDVGSGPVTVELPSGNDAYDVTVDGGSGPLRLMLEDNTEMALDIEGGSGPINVFIEDDSDIAMTIDAGSGPFTINLPQSNGIRLEVRDSGSGPLNLSGRFHLVDNGGDNDSKTGTWEVDGFDEAEYQIIITIEMGSGPLTVR